MAVTWIATAVAPDGTDPEVPSQAVAPTTVTVEVPPEDSGAAGEMFEHPEPDRVSTILKGVTGTNRFPVALAVCDVVAASATEGAMPRASTTAADRATNLETTESLRLEYPAPTSRPSEPGSDDLAPADLLNLFTWVLSLLVIAVWPVEPFSPARQTAPVDTSGVTLDTTRVAVKHRRAFSAKSLGKIGAF